MTPSLIESVGAAMLRAGLDTFDPTPELVAEIAAAAADATLAMIRQAALPYGVYSRDGVIAAVLVTLDATRPRKDGK